MASYDGTIHVKAEDCSNIESTPVFLRVDGKHLTVTGFLTLDAARSLHADLSAILEDAAITTEAE